ncbi:MAG: hypothetical protein RJB13_1998 [Pseudomonadota bacterium]
MSTPSLRRVLSLMTVAFSLPLVVTSSCGRPPVEDIEEPGGTLTVTGAFSDWSPEAGVYNNGLFILFDAQSSEVFKSEPINAGTPSFSISDVPVSGKYYGILIDSQYRAHAYLQKTNSENKIMRIFQLNSSQGKLGILVPRDSKLEASEQDKLEFINLGVSAGTAEIFDKSFSTQFNFDPDIDLDGIPNQLDTDVDGDAIENIFDPKTYNGSEINDSNIPWQYNYGYGIPRTGFFKCDHLFSQKSATDPTTYELKGSCSLRAPEGKVESVKIQTNATFMSNAKLPDGSAAFDWIMHDDGASGDLISGDGIWTGQFTLSAEQWSRVEGQIFIATVTYKNGVVRSYLTTFETIKTDEKLSILANVDLESDKIKITAKLQDISGNESFQASLTLIDSENNSEIITLSQDLKEMSLTFPEEDSPSLNEIISTYLSKKPNSPTEVTLRVKLKISAPAALPGLLGSAFESYFIPEGDEAPLTYSIDE